MLAPMKLSMGILFLVVVLIFLIFANGNLFAGDPEKAAIQAAEPWLAFMDTGENGDSWNQGAGLFRGATTRA